MNEETAIVKQEGSIQTYFVATNNREMIAAQQGLVSWVEAKVANIKNNIAALSASINIAKERKWAMKPLVGQRNRALGMRTYYEKMLEALKAGYVLIPEFQNSCFAVRVKRETPLVQESVASYAHSDPIQNHPSDKLPVGEGEYKNAEVQRYYNVETGPKDSKGNEVTSYRFHNSEEFSDIAFPLIACKPEVMSAAARAMALKIFDELGVTPSRRIKGDPIIVGVIRSPKYGWGMEKTCHFLISWHINVQDL